MDSLEQLQRSPFEFPCQQAGRGRSGPERRLLGLRGSHHALDVVNVLNEHDPPHADLHTEDRPVGRLQFAQHAAHIFCGVLGYKQRTYGYTWLFWNWTEKVPFPPLPSPPPPLLLAFPVVRSSDWQSPLSPPLGRRVVCLVLTTTTTR